MFATDPRRWLPLACLLGSAAQAGPPPDWYRAHVDRLVADGGVWLADNSRYRSEQERFEAYGLAWQPGVGGLSAKGRLYGVVDGQDGGTIWEFRLYWHPGEDQAHLLQLGGGGAVLDGPLQHEDGVERLQQTFYAPDGSQWQTGHLTHWSGDSEHVGKSFRISEDGEWIEQRSYTWIRQPTR
ncbi:MAG: hypothetical protein KDI48_06535 [Xanthomonadales bacterium]|nr:hypothetical protein [Xanthomonadales bacterium]